MTKYLIVLCLLFSFSVQAKQRHAVNPQIKHHKKYRYKDGARCLDAKGHWRKGCK